MKGSQLNSWVAPPQLDFYLFMNLLVVMAADPQGAKHQPLL